MGKWTSVRADGQAAPPTPTTTTIAVARAAAVASYQMLSQLWIKEKKIIRNVTNNR